MTRKTYFGEELGNWQEKWVGTIRFVDREVKAYLFVWSGSPGDRNRVERTAKEGFRRVRL